MLVSVFGSSNVSGNATREYKQDEIVECKEDWQVVLGNIFLQEGQAIEVKVADKPKVTKPKAKKKVAKK